MKVGKGSCNGTFGELLQGELNGQPFLITLPIKTLQSEATFQPKATDSSVMGSPQKPKAILACERFLTLSGITSGGTLQIESNIPAGKGMASSSADIVAAIRACANSFRLPVTPEIISAIASEIEPTDGVMYQDVVVYDYRNGHLLEKLGVMPHFSIIGMDVGGVVDTVTFNRKSKQYTDQERKAFKNAYERMKDGIRVGNLDFIMEASTISARINQRLLANPYFEQFERLANKLHSGVVVAHSGTMIGLLVDPRRFNVTDLMAQIASEISSFTRNNKAQPLLYFGGDRKNSAHREIKVKEGSGMC